MKNASDFKWRFNLGNYTFKVLGYGDYDFSRYLRALMHLETPGLLNEQVTIHLIDTRTTGFSPPKEGLKWEKVNPYNGELLNFGEQKAVYNTGELSFTLVDYKQKEIYYWVSDFNRLPPNETAAPLRSLFHHWFETTSMFLCHAGGLGLAGKGVLLTGKSGAGKSTSTLACLESSLSYGGDDFILVDSENCRAYSLYGVAKLNTEQFSRFPHLKKHISNREQLPHEKGHVYIDDIAKNKMINNFRIEALLLPTITGKTHTFIQECSKADAVMALVPSSVWILRSSVSTAEKMKVFISKVPTYRLMAGTELRQIPEVLIHKLNHDN
ncbi:hypothetical protein [Leadbetterella sp. DM7]|uniref:hypothetical protein n=1 Tax=Leadbetterella sp. DM7 TaxID=3235085 RepID=UPI00349EB4B3